MALCISLKPKEPVLQEIASLLLCALTADDGQKQESGCYRFSACRLVKAGAFFNHKIHKAFVARSGRKRSLSLDRLVQ